MKTTNNSFIINLAEYLRLRQQQAVVMDTQSGAFLLATGILSSTVDECSVLRLIKADVGTGSQGMHVNETNCLEYISDSLFSLSGEDCASESRGFGQSYTGEFIRLHRVLINGRRHDLAIAGLPKGDDENRIAHTVICAMITTWLSCADAQERDNMEWFLDHMPFAVFCKNNRGLLLGCNDRFAKLIDYSKDYIIGKSDYDFNFTQTDIKAARREDTYVLRHNEPLQSLYRVKYKDWNVITKYPITPQQNPKHNCVIGIVKDISQHRLADHYGLLQQLKEKSFLNEIVSVQVKVAFLFKLESTLPIMYVSDNVERIGLNMNDIYPGKTDFIHYVHVEDRQMLYETFVENGGLMDQFEVTFRVYGHCDSIVHVSCTARVVHVKETDEVVVQGHMSRMQNEDLNYVSSHKGWINAMHLMDNIQVSHDGLETMKYILDRAAPMIYIVDIDTRELLYANPNAVEGRDGCANCDTVCYKWLYEGRAEACPFCPISMVIGVDGTPTKPVITEYYDRESKKWYHSTSYALKWVDGRMAMFTQKYDITHSKALDLKLEQLPYLDTALNLPNRNKLVENLKVAIESCTTDKRVALMAINLDDFKNINFAYGFDIGNMLLRSISNFMKNLHAANKTVYRTYGDEFMILLNNESDESIERFVKAVYARFNMPWQIGDREIFCTASIGVTTHPGHSGTADNLLRDSIMAMQMAKKAGKRRLKYYNPEEEDNVEDNLKLEFKLRKAINNGCEGFAVYYQPVIDARTDKWIGVEALARWADDEQGLIMPNVFIPLAESLDLINQLDTWVMRTAIQQLMESGLHEDGRFALSVNISPIQINDPNLLNEIRGILDESGYKPEQLVMEVTESTAITDMQKAVSKLAQIREMGIKIAMDDFGTGFSSLYNMKHMPVDTLKIDRAFVHELTHDGFNQAFIKTISMLAHTSGMSVCAEGVENAEQKHILVDKDSDYLQGYLFGRPMPLDDLISKVAH